MLRISRRLFSVSQRQFGREKKQKIVLDEGTAWLENGAGKQFDNLSARNWLHPERPFPKNPWFVPSTPVGDQMRLEIYEKYLSDPKKWTPRQLAIEYKLSVVRIEAILRLKHLESTQQKQGYVMQEKFAAKMESLLGVGRAGGQRLTEPVDITPIRPSITKMTEYQVSASDTTKETSDDIYQRRRDGNYVMALSGVVEEPEEPPKILEHQNSRETNQRWKFIIADISQPVDADRAVYVRDNDGTLRTATRTEREIHSSLYPLTPKEKAEESRDAPALWKI